MHKTIHQMFTSFASGLGLLAAVSAVPAQAVSIQDFFDPHKGFSSNTSLDIKSGAERLALSTEAYRDKSRAACINEELIPKGQWDASGFAGLQAHLIEDRDSGETRLTVEDVILNAIDVACPNGNVGQVSVTAPKAPFQSTTPASFDAKYPNPLARVLMLSVSFKTQGLRSMRVHDVERGKCIANNFEVTAENGDYLVPKAFQDAARGLARAASVEQHIIESIKAKCGEDGPDKDGSKIASATPD